MKRKRYSVEQSGGSEAARHGAAGGGHCPQAEDCGADVLSLEEAVGGGGH